MEYTMRFSSKTPPLPLRTAHTDACDTAIRTLPYSAYRMGGPITLRYIEFLHQAGILGGKSKLQH